MKISGNKGEWSELYVLIKLLAEGKIYSAKENLQKNESCWFPILKIFREESGNNKIEYVQSNKNFIEIYFNGRLAKKISNDELARASNFFYGEIVKGNGTFEIDGAENFMQDLRCKKIKADSEDKTDIQMEIHDPFTNFERICGFSIKSDLGSPPTLFNSSQATNFQFEIFGLNDFEVEEINTIKTKNKIRDRINKIPEMKFTKILSETFSKNLLFIDTQMEKILAEMLKIYYGKGISDCNEVATFLDEKDFLKFGAENLYSHKLKKFLCAVALGLRPKKIWNGLDEANGGYIIVKESGEVLAYHLHDRDGFENYLINNTKFDTPSTKKHKFGKIYVENGQKFINLNLQIRFK